MNIPVLHAEGRSLAEAYERALILLFEKGIRIKTQYDKEDDPASIDATMNITTLEPDAEPLIHKAFPGGIEDLREYVMELSGAKDHWVKNMNDADDTRWEYTYHQRLADWGTWMEGRDGERVKTGITGGPGINQVEKVVDKLAAQPFTRQAQMITWMPVMDFDVYDPPCLQSLWYRLLEDETAYWLNCNIRFRSNDAWGAHFMNAFGFLEFNRRLIAAPLSARLGKPVKLGRLNWQADSFHIYGKDQKQFKELFWDRLDTTDFEERTYRFDDEVIREIYTEAEAAVTQKIRDFDSRDN
jgi:thymidylate synthase